MFTRVRLRLLTLSRRGLFRERFSAMVAQLGDDRPAVRLAGVHAMAALADEWEAYRQRCIDVLCAYLRTPYEPEPGPNAPRADRLAFRASREVRHTVISVIASHLRSDAAVSWQGHGLDFTGATFDGGDFSLARFTGQVSFAGARFTGRVSFFRCEFTGQVRFDGATFTGDGLVSFARTEFTAGAVSFADAKFAGGRVGFDAAEFAGGRVSFGRAEFAGGRVSFDHAGFTGCLVSFDLAEFTGGRVSFGSTEFAGGRVSFGRAEFAGGRVSFELAKFAGAEVDLASAEFTGGGVDLSQAADLSRPPVFGSAGSSPS